MPDNTTKRPTIQDSDLHGDTVVYRACKPRVRAVEINVFEEIGTILNFHPSGLRVAREIIRRQHGENVTISCTDAEGAEACWPDLPAATRLTKFVRAKRNLIEDQDDSNFRFVWKVPRQVEQKEDGSYYGLPSKYRPGDYWSVSDELQFRSNQVGREFLAMPAYKCRRMEREILTEILGERKCKKIVRERKKKEEREPKEKTDSLPSRVEELRRQPNEDFSVDLEWFADRFEQHLRELGEVGRNFAIQVRRVHNALEIAEQSAREMITTENKRESARQYIKLIGGQPK